MSVATEDLFRSGEIVVRGVFSGVRDVAFITFGPRSNRSDLDRPGFDEVHLRSKGFDAVHLLSRRNNWYQHGDMESALAAAAKRLAGYRHVVAYGSGMGGFAALTYGAACGARSAIALSPQFSIDPTIVPFETRWRADARKIRFRNATYPRVAMQYIVYDPFVADDRRHVDLLSKVAPTFLIHAPNGGHPVDSFVHDTGILDPLLEAVAEESLLSAEAPLIEACLWKQRRLSGHYFYTLARHVPDHRPRHKLMLATLAANKQPENPVFLSFQAAMLERNGRTGEADSFYLAAMALQGANSRPGLTLIANLRESCRSSEAEQFAEALSQRYSASRNTKAGLRLILPGNFGRAAIDRIFSQLG